LFYTNVTAVSMKEMSCQSACFISEIAKCR